MREKKKLCAGFQCAHTETIMLIGFAFTFLDMNI